MARSARRRATLPALLVAALGLFLGGAAFAAVETDSVPSFWYGLLWSLSLLTTVGFVDGAPSSAAGQVVAAGLMTIGFVLLALVSASLASLFVRDDEGPELDRQSDRTDELLAELRELRRRVEELDRRER